MVCVVYLPHAKGKTKESRKHPGTEEPEPTKSVMVKQQTSPLFDSNGRESRITAVFALMFR